MLPVVALVGRPNVGKSTLFNYLTQTRDALVADYPGLTRDRQYGQVTREGRPFLVVDTGGIIEQAEGIEDHAMRQVWAALDEADVVVSGGRGTKGDFKDVEALADALGAAVGASRAPSSVYPTSTANLWNPAVPATRWTATPAGKSLALSVKL